MDNLGVLEKVIEPEKPKYKRDAFIYFALTAYVYFNFNYINYKYYPYSLYVPKIIAFCFFVRALFLIIKHFNYSLPFESIELYTHGLKVDGLYFDYKNIILEIKNCPTKIKLVFKGNNYSKTICLSKKNKGVYTIIEKIKKYNTTSYVV